MGFPHSGASSGDQCRNRRCISATWLDRLRDTASDGPLGTFTFSSQVTRADTPRNFRRISIVCRSLRIAVSLLARWAGT